MVSGGRSPHIFLRCVAKSGILKGLVGADDGVNGAKVQPRRVIIIT